MQFNSIQFVVFFALVACLYFALPHRFRWIMLLVASYYFYMCWRISYVVLIAATTLVSYATALLMERSATPKGRRLCLLLSLGINLGLLFAFKYLNLASSSLNSCLQCFGMPHRLPLSSLLLPVGISFYTFQTLSYTLDVYRGDRPPERHLGIFALYVSFFPQLVAGPIERSTRLLPQFRETHRFEYAEVVGGMKQMLWGFVKKVVIADRLAIYVNQVYDDPGTYTGLPLLLATYFFAFQIYCDFSGYSDIAIGAGRVMGFRLMRNFDAPYFARSVGEFWKRWHISLSTWFRDYLYFPLGGSRTSRLRWHFNLFVVFLVSGLWHGANWTFAAWGCLHALFLLASVWFAPVRTRLSHVLRLDRLPALLTVMQVTITFHLVAFAWILFRANSLSDAGTIVRGIFSLTPVRLGYGGIAVGLARGDVLMMLFSCVALMWLDYGGRLDRLMASARPIVRWTMYVALLFLLVTAGFYKPSEFIYFQF
jgi:alginate O-acetyltransferase complex protein AlgI